MFFQGDLHIVDTFRDIEHEKVKQWKIPLSNSYQLALVGSTIWRNCQVLSCCVYIYIYNFSCLEVIVSYATFSHVLYLFHMQWDPVLSTLVMGVIHYLPFPPPPPPSIILKSICPFCRRKNTQMPNVQQFNGSVFCVAVTNQLI